MKGSRSRRPVGVPTTTAGDHLDGLPLGGEQARREPARVRGGGREGRGRVTPSHGAPGPSDQRALLRER